MQKSFWSITLGCSLLSPAIVIPTAQAVSLELIPAVQTVKVGDSLEVDVRISGLGDFQAPSMSGFALGLSFDPSLLKFKSLSFGDRLLGNLVGLSPETTFSDFQTNGGLVSFSQVSLDDEFSLNKAQPASFILGTVSFTAVRAGNSLLSLSFNDDSFIDEQGNPLLLSTIPKGASITINNGSTQVPEPNFNWLALGLVALGATFINKKTNLSI
ncbi:cohesin domain-containing protein [Nostoc sp. MS1]|uniref:cohesin domain-containing protein n=1 Tax=Nostoc sp. MS1 TaxID=2764711 RepID=UPI001CC501AD|nr:cohesin domain-containing protein [Nostoc sp. MS1]BCL35090.1 hypothetical protein NSMS1_15370 [Nostoc sp. MS1]